MLNLIRLARTNDKSLFSIFKKLAERLDANDFTINHVGNSSWNQSEKDAPDYKSTSYLIETMEMSSSARSARLTFRRGLFDGNVAQGNHVLSHGTFVNFRKSSIYDEILLSGDGRLSFEEATSFDKLISPIRVDAGEAEEGEESLSSIVAAQIEQLRELALEFSQRQMEAESRLEDVYKKRESDLERRIHAEDARLLERTQPENAKLVEERAKIEAWRDEINDREPQHERRRLREVLTTDLRNIVKNPPAKAVNREWLSNSLYIFVGLSFVVLSAWLTMTSTTVSSGTAAFWTTASKSLIAGIGGAAFIWAGLSGLKATAKVAREFEHDMQRYSFDMDRASWIVETILQMNISEASQVPDQWLSSVCRDLFNSSKLTSDNVKPLDALAALLDVTAGAKLGTNGVEFQIDRKGMKKAAAD